MAESQTVTILRAKRDAIAAAIENYERLVEQAKADFTHVTAALEIFEAQDAPESQRVYVSLYRYFRYGELATLCRGFLENGPMTTPDLAKAVMAAKGLDATDKVMARSVGFSVLQSMRGLARRKMVTKTRAKTKCIWGMV